MTGSRGTLRVALVGGPMYDRLYDRFAEFEKETGWQVEIGFKDTHPALNDHIAQVYSSGIGQYDVISTHTKYAPSQAQWLYPLDEWVTDEEIAEFGPSIIELARIKGKLYGLPRNIDVRLLYYRTDWVGEKGPETWEELADIAERVADFPHRAGFVYPGRFSGLFGTFFELLSSAGGQLFFADLRPAFNSEEGKWALNYLRDLHFVRKVTLPELPDMHYDEVASAFKTSRAAMVHDWPGGYEYMIDPATSEAAGHVGLAALPKGPAGLRCAYAGGFTFAIPRSVQDLDGALALMRSLTSYESQLLEAQGGALSVRPAVHQHIVNSTEPGSLEEHRMRLLDETVSQYAIIPPKFPSYPQVEDTLWEVLQAAILDKLTVDEALSSLERKVTEIVQGEG